MSKELNPSEHYFVARQAWLETRGYRLRARYQPDWIPSWVTNPPKGNQRFPRDREDFHSRMRFVADAVRIRDNLPVILKPVFRPEMLEDHEISIIGYLSQPDVTQDPQNKCVPIYEVLYDIPDDPERAIIVMPLLRRFDDPRFDTVGECLGMFRDIFQGLQFLHRHRIAHRDCTGNNLMMDGSELYPDGFHPLMQEKNLQFTADAIQRYTRTQRPPKYYWIDFGLSVRFEESDKFPRVGVIWGGDSSPPEFQDPDYMSHEQDPFPTDIYYLGNLIREFFTDGHSSEIDGINGLKYDLSFMKPLAEAMCHADRSKRPTIDQCVVHLEEIIRSQSSWKLRSQVWHDTDNIFGFIYRFFPHWIRRITYILTQTPAIPKAA